MKAESESFLTIKYTRKSVSYLQCRKKNWEKFFFSRRSLRPLSYYIPSESLGECSSSEDVDESENSCDCAYAIKHFSKPLIQP